MLAAARLTPSAYPHPSAFSEEVERAPASAPPDEHVWRPPPPQQRSPPPPQQHGYSPLRESYAPPCSMHPGYRQSGCASHPLAAEVACEMGAASCGEGAALGEGAWGGAHTSDAGMYYVDVEPLFVETSSPVARASSPLRAGRAFVVPSLSAQGVPTGPPTCSTLGRTSRATSRSTSRSTSPAPGPHPEATPAQRAAQEARLGAMRAMRGGTPTDNDRERVKRRVEERLQRARSSSSSCRGSGAAARGFGQG